MFDLLSLALLQLEWERSRCRENPSFDYQQILINKKTTCVRTFIQQYSFEIFERFVESSRLKKCFNIFNIFNRYNRIIESDSKFNHETFLSLTLSLLFIILC